MTPSHSTGGANSNNSSNRGRRQSVSARRRRKPCRALAPPVDKHVIAHGRNGRLRWQHQVDAQAADFDRQACRTSEKTGPDNARGTTIGIRQVDRFRPETGPAPFAGDAGYKLRRQYIRRTYKVSDKSRFRLAINFARGSHLHHAAVVEQRDPVRHRQRLVLIVGHEDKGDAELPVQVFQFFLHLFAQLEVERTKGFIEQ
jgi:hypothetical protein